MMAEPFHTLTRAPKRSKPTITVAVKSGETAFLDVLIAVGEPDAEKLLLAVGRTGTFTVPAVIEAGQRLGPVVCQAVPIGYNTVTGQSYGTTVRCR